MRLEFSFAAEHNVKAIGQRLLQRKPRSVSHHAGMTRGSFLEELHVRRVVPRQLSFFANCSISSYRDDSNDHDQNVLQAASLQIVVKGKVVLGLQQQAGSLLYLTPPLARRDMI